MQAASTLWPDIKSQKISKQRFRLNWTKCSPRTTPKHIKTRQTLAFRQVEAQDNPLEEDGGGWRPGQVDRPTWSAELARGPHRLNFNTCHLLTGCSSRFCKISPVAPCYKYRGVEIMTHTPHFLSSLAFLA